MLNLRSYQETLQTIRDAPCLEYPGYYVVSFGKDSVEEKVFRDIQEAISFSKRMAGIHIPGSIWWHCSSNDPRKNEVWFAGKYKAYQW